MNILKSKFWLFATLLYPWLFVWQGLDLTDAGFSLSQYSSFFNNFDNTINALFLTNFLGAIWNETFGWIGFVGFKIAHIFNIYIILYLSYIILKKYDKQNIIFFALFVPMAFLINSGTNWINYNSFSSLFYMLVLLFIYLGYKKSNFLFYFIAGVFAGLNIFIRFPNLVDLFMIFAIIFVVDKNRIFKIFFYYILGYISSIILIFLILKFFSLEHIYIDSIKEIFQLSQSNSIHGSTSLLNKLIFDHQKVFIAFIFIIVFFKIISYIILKQNNIIQWVSILLISFSSLYIFPLLNSWKWIYVALFYFSFIFIFYKEKNSKDLKLLALLSLLLLFFIPLGSGNGIHNSKYGMWFSFAFIIIYFSNIKELFLSKYFYLNKNSLDFIKKLIILSTLVYAFVHSYKYTSRDTSNRINMVYSINHPKLIGTFTTKKRAKVLSEFLKALEPIIQDRELFLYEKIANIYYLTNKPFPLSHPWVTYIKPNIFKKEFLLYKNKLPIIARPKFSVSNYKWPYIKFPHSKNINKVKNRKIIEKFIEKNRYKIIWENDFFEILDIDER